MLRFCASTAANTHVHLAIAPVLHHPQQITNNIKPVLHELLRLVLLTAANRVQNIKPLSFCTLSPSLKLLFLSSFLHSIPDAQTFVPFSLLRSLTSNAQTNNSNSFILLRSIPDFERKNPSFHCPSFIHIYLEIFKFGMINKLGFCVLWKSWQFDFVFFFFYSHSHLMILVEVSEWLFFWFVLLLLFDDIFVVEFGFLVCCLFIDGLMFVFRVCDFICWRNPLNSEEIKYFCLFNSLCLIDCLLFYRWIIVYFISISLFDIWVRV